ncbi:hypothetical protein [Tritonibacter mobilis]|uniref:hypothetical protein n=1 Tax=Tritonibacter mobilis TaxID=379347 RepID=UPI000806A58E|nr:hypothetical protein [Tritonibacter mobilis]
MDVAEIYFAFHRRATLREVLRGETAWTSIFGHVEAFGYTIDETWFFFDPGRSLTSLKITHLHDEVEALLKDRFDRAEVLYRFPFVPCEFRFPLHFSMNCVTQCAALIGRRAFTPSGFQRILRESNAEVIHGPQKQRGSS